MLATLFPWGLCFWKCMFFFEIDGLRYIFFWTVVSSCHIIPEACRIHRQWVPYAMIGIISQFSRDQNRLDPFVYQQQLVKRLTIILGESCHDHGSDHGMFSLYLLLPESVPWHMPFPHRPLSTVPQPKSSIFSPCNPTSFWGALGSPMKKCS